MNRESFLERIIASRRRDVAGATDAAQVRQRAESGSRKPHRLRAALCGDGINIIGEFKRASPSLGPIRLHADVQQTVRAYEAAAVRALSVLTEPAFFHGSLDDLRRAAATTHLPILRKDFTISEYQIDEAAVAGAAAVLLIVAALTDDELRRFRIRAEEQLGLDALVEVHNADEMQRASDCGAKLIGVNNRDLRTFTTSLETSERLAASAPRDAVLVSESGIATRADIVRLARFGYRGFLIGESLMRADQPAALLRNLRGEPQIKICGITTVADARLCAELGVEMIGLNFSPQSKRCLLPNDARKIIEAIRPQFPALKFVGVFVDQPLEFVQKIARDLQLHGVQLHGDEPPAYVRQIGAPFVVKALRVSATFSSDDAAHYGCDAILLDTHSASAPGGTGERFDWSVARAVAPQVKRLILAGGLSPENVGDAIAATRPFAVDVCSGVERAPGVKDAEQLRRFVAAARQSPTG